MGSIIAMASGKGGTGKSTAAAFLGRALALRGKTVLLAEAPCGFRSLDLAFGLEDSAVYDCADVLRGACRVSDAALDTGTLGLWLLPGSSDPSFAAEPPQWQRLMDLCRRCYDFTLLDLPAGLGPVVRMGCAAADLTAAVVTPDPPAVRAATALGRVLQGARSAKMIINMVPPVLLGPLPDLDAVMDGVGMELLGVVPLEPQVARAAAGGVPLGRCRARTAFDNIAARLCKEPRPLCIK